MNKREFLLGTAELSAKVREHIYNNGMNIQGTPWNPKSIPAQTTTQAKLKSATDAEIDELYLAIGVEYTEESANDVVKRQVVAVPADLLKDELREEVVTKKGERVPVIMVAFDERTSGKTRNFKFTMKNGMSVIVNPYDNIIALDLQKGDLFPINPDTIVFTNQEGYLFAKPNFSHAIFSDVVNNRQEFAEKMEKWETSMRIQGVQQKEINAQRTKQALENTPMPKLKGFKFLK